MVSRMAGMLACSLALMLVALPALVSAALFPAKSAVVQLSQSSFKKEVLDIEKPTLVAFTAPWCGHCKSLAPEFHRAATNLDGIVKFANIDCDADGNKGICAQYQVQGFPTIKLFPATKKRLPRDYRGERAAKALVEFAKDALPMGARKLLGEELEGWVNEAPARPKVILYSAKPKSSPLYRSLALDFRKSIDFAFMRGDESLVRSTGRLVLGVDIPTSATLPVLLIVPARKVDADGNFPPLEKGSFETYVGPLKYHPIKKWLDEVAPRMMKGGEGSKLADGAAAKAKKASEKVKTKYAEAKEKVAPKAEEVLPDGGFVEWKAAPGAGQKVFGGGDDAKDKKASAGAGDDEPIMDESAPGKETWRGKMLDIERAGEIADDLREQAAEVGRRTRKFASLFSPEINDDLGDGKSGEANASGDSLLGKAEAAAGWVADKAAKAYDGAVGGGGATDVAKGSPFDRKSDALMKQFQKWMAGEAPQDWEENLGDQFARAQAEAEELLRKDPEEARRQAWESEEWLLKQMRGDRQRMMSVMTVEQRAQVDNMIELIESRLAKKENMNPFSRDKDTQFPFAQDQVTDSGGKKAHDEL